MEYKENLGARCNNCAYEGGTNEKACRKCATQDNRKGWEPAPGVQVRTYEVYWGALKIRAIGREVIGGRIDG